MNAFNVALLGSCCAVSAASADTVKMAFVGTGAGRDVSISINGVTGNHFAGQLFHGFSNGTGSAANLTGVHVTFCADAMEYTSNKWATHNVAPISQLPASYGYAAMGEDRAQAIYDLYGAAGGAQVAAGADADMAAAFQIALWEVVYDFDASEGRSSLDVTDGAMKTTALGGGALSGSIVTWVNSFFDSIISLNASQGGLVGLALQGRQDQIVMIPLPPAALAGLTGLAGLGIVTAFRRRSKG